jgi:hypothetical protein
VWLGLVDQPRGHPGHCKVFLATDQIDLAGIVLQTRAYVLKSESTMTDDADILTVNLLVIKIIPNAVCDRAAELIFTSIDLSARDR